MPTATRHGVHLVEGDEYAQPVHAHDRDDGAAARRADQGARIQPARGHIPRDRRGDAGLAKPNGQARNLRLGRGLGRFGGGQGSAGRLQFLLATTTRGRKLPGPFVGGARQGGLGLDLSDTAAGGGKLIGQIARTNQGHDLALLDLVPAIDQNGIQVTQHLRPDIGLLQRAQVDRRPHLDGYITRNHLGDHDRRRQLTFGSAAGLALATPHGHPDEQNQRESRAGGPADGAAKKGNQHG